MVNGPSKEREAIKQTFKEADANGDGTIDRNELMAILKDTLKDFSDDELAELFDSADKNQDGSLNYDEFLEWVFSGDEGGELVEEAVSKRQVNKKLQQSKKIKVKLESGK